MSAPFNATDGWAFGILAAAFFMPWLARRWDRRVERNATRHQVQLRQRSHVRVVPPRQANASNLYDWERDEYGWPS